MKAAALSLLTALAAGKTMEMMKEESSSPLHRRASSAFEAELWNKEVERIRRDERRRLAEDLWLSAEARPLIPASR
jgi:hypothetical protein